MTASADVPIAACRILKDGPGDELAGTGFFVLPGYVLTCHHVVYGLCDLRVFAHGDLQPRLATYRDDLSDPEGDLAVLQVPGPVPGCVQLGAPRANVQVEGVGYRPADTKTEPDGHTFSGDLKTGQRLRLPEPDVAPECGQNHPWNVLPSAMRETSVLNFRGAVELEQGISGGPVYDIEQRKVVGLFRAVERQTLAYVIPANNALTRWPALLEENRTQVPDSQLDALAREFKIRPILEGAHSLTSLGDDYFLDFLATDQVFGQPPTFGGRQAELARLDAFARLPDGGYFLVTGLSGFGKSALLSAWVRTLSARRIGHVVYFITPRRSIEEQQFLQNLCAAILAFHGLGTETTDLAKPIDVMRSLFRSLLRFQSSNAGTLVVVIDGLDEALGKWDADPGPSLFPSALSPNLRVVFSARSMAGLDWPARLGLDLPAARQIELKALGAEEVRDVVARSRLASLPADRIEVIARELERRTHGDPFFLRDLLAMVEANNGDLSDLANFPPTQSAYLQRWWDEGRTRVGAEPFEDLLGMLASAPRPLSQEELVIANAEAPRGALTRSNVYGVLQAASHYVVGNEAGYAIGHERIRAFVAEMLAERVPVYHRRLAPYLQRDAAQRAREYAVVRAAGDKPGEAWTLDFNEGVGAFAAGVDARPYLKGLGITLTDVTPGSRVEIIDMRRYYGGNGVVSLTPPNVLTQTATSEMPEPRQRPVSFTLVFDRPLRRLSLTRPYLFAATSSGVTHPEWRAEAFSGDKLVGLPVGEDIWRFSVRGWYDRIAPRVFTLEGPNITALRIRSDNQQFAGSLAVLIDDLTIVPMQTRFGNARAKEKR